MSEQRRYYWLKLDRNFFKRHDIRVVEEMPNGKDYILFYMKLLVESVTHEGALRFSETIPYNSQMLSIVTNTNPDIVEKAIQIFKELKMLEVLDDGTIYMMDVEKMVGSETQEAVKKRNYRKRMEMERGQCPQLVPDLSRHCPTEKEKEKEKELEKDIGKKNIKESQPADDVSKEELEDFIRERGGIV